jgi:hypothetical protein
MPKHYRTVEDHFDALLIKSDSCWVLSTSLTTHGYSRFEHRGIIYAGHVFSYERFKKKVTTGLVVHHKCENRACVNPDHLDEITQRENVLAGVTNIVTINLNKTHCNKGHEFTEENTYVYKAERQCRICRKENTAKSVATRGFLNALAKIKY